MSPAKVLLLSCIVMMHISFMASRPVEQNHLQENLRKINLHCQDLRRIELNYTQIMFPRQAPSGLNIPAKGISMGNTSEEINSSICAISKYLRNHTKTIVSDTLKDAMEKEILDVIEKFTHEFEKAAGVHTDQCDIASLDTDDFKKKELGCQILSSITQWVEHFSHKSCKTTQ